VRLYCIMCGRGVHCVRAEFKRRMEMFIAQGGHWRHSKNWLAFGTVCTGCMKEYKKWVE
jgi:hypothetical protein